MAPLQGRTEIFLVKSSMLIFSLLILEVVNSFTGQRRNELPVFLFAQKASAFFLHEPRRSFIDPPCFSGHIVISVVRHAICCASLMPRSSSSGCARHFRTITDPIFASVLLSSSPQSSSQSASISTYQVLRAVLAVVIVLHHILRNHLHRIRRHRASRPDYHPSRLHRLNTEKLISSSIFAQHPGNTGKDHLVLGFQASFPFLGILEGIQKHGLEPVKCRIVPFSYTAR